YAALCKVVRECGFKVALVAHYSAVFQDIVMCGTGIYASMLAAVLSLPKQLVTVYIGVGVMLESDPSCESSPVLVCYVARSHTLQHLALSLAGLLVM
ncbi:hypothetical protein BDR03DRAFT_865745, partial [Suillus americanus]